MMKFTEYNFDFLCAVGLSGVLFTLLYISCNFKKYAELNVFFFGILPVKSKYCPFTYLMLIQVVSPNSSFIGHLSGILAGVFIKYLMVYLTFPRKEWIVAFESGFPRLVYFLKMVNYADISSLDTENSEELEEFNKKICN